MKALWSRWRVIVVPVLLIAAIGVAVWAQREKPTGPPDITYGVDICYQCGMIISDPRFAAAYRLESDVARKFDDLGEMLAALPKEEETIVEIWIHDFESEEWIDAKTAVYVHSDQLQTPMGFAIAAFSDAERAHAFARGWDGRVMTWDDLASGDTVPVEEHVP